MYNRLCGCSRGGERKRARTHARAHAFPSALRLESFLDENPRMSNVIRLGDERRRKIHRRQRGAGRVTGVREVPEKRRRKVTGIREELKK